MSCKNLNKRGQATLKIKKKLRIIKEKLTIY